jgi:hypothetical protein
MFHGGALHLSYTAKGPIDNFFIHQESHAKWSKLSYLIPKH